VSLFQNANYMREHEFSEPAVSEPQVRVSSGSDGKETPRREKQDEK
jgi:hypothetical protein